MKFRVWRLHVAACLLMTLNSVALAQVIVPPGGSISVPAGGSMSLACTALTVQGTLNVGSGQVSNTGDVGIGAGGVINGGQGALSVSGNWHNSGTFNAGTGTVTFVDGCATDPLTLAGTTVFNNLTLTSANGRTFVISADSNITVMGTLTLQGANDQPIHLVSSSGQTAVINLGPQSHVVSNYFDVNAVQIGATPKGIPTLSEYGLLILALLMALTALWQGNQGAFKMTRRNKEHQTEPASTCLNHLTPNASQ